MTFDVLIIGLGQIGMRYDLNLDSKRYVYSHASAFSQHRGFNLVGGVDTDNRAGKTFERKYGCAFYDNVQEALQQHDPDVIVISVSTQFHKQVLQDIVRYSKPKVVLCEKPLSYNIDEAYEMQQLCKDNSVQLFVNYIRDSDPNSIEIKTKIGNGEYAGLLKGVVWYSKGLIHNGSHFLNLLEYWLGPIKESRCISKGRLFDNQDPEPDFSLTFEKGDVVFLSTKEENFSHYTIELIFENGRLRYEKGGEKVYWTPVQQDPNLPAYKVLSHSSVYYNARSMNKYQLHVANELWNMLNQETYALCSDLMAITTLESIVNIIKECE
jgi:predicted dehydrogenase